MDNAGQAALTDSLFFIAIIAVLSTGLFYFAINYGLSTEAMLNSFYSSDFAMDSLKVVTYVNIMRDGSPVNLNSYSTENAPQGQFDYMLALVKEDYSRNSEISPSTKKAIANTLHSVLKPFDSSIDYVFFIALESSGVGEKKFVALILATRKCMAENNDCSNISQGEDLPIKRVYYACDPAVSNVLEKYIYPNVGKVDSAIGTIGLRSKSEDYERFLIGMNLWVARKIEPIERIIATGEEPDPAKRDPEFNCVLIDTA